MMYQSNNNKNIPSSNPDLFKSQIFRCLAAPQLFLKPAPMRRRVVTLHTKQLLPTKLLRQHTLHTFFVRNQRKVEL